VPHGGIVLIRWAWPIVDRMMAEAMLQCKMLRRERWEISSKTKQSQCDYGRSRLSIRPQLSGGRGHGHSREWEGLAEGLACGFRNAGTTMSESRKTGSLRWMMVR